MMVKLLIREVIEGIYNMDNPSPNGRYILEIISGEVSSDENFPAEVGK